MLGTCQDGGRSAPDDAGAFPRRVDVTSERDNQNGPGGQQQQGEQAQQQQSGEYAQGGQADYGSPRGGSDDGAFFAQGGEGQAGGGEGGEGMSKEEWLRQNPDGAYDPPEAPGEGMSKEEWLRQNPGEEQGSGKDGGGRY
jgi:hypothetical protein